MHRAALVALIRERMMVSAADAEIRRVHHGVDARRAGMLIMAGNEAGQLGENKDPDHPWNDVTDAPNPKHVGRSPWIENAGNSGDFKTGTGTGA